MYFIRNKKQLKFVCIKNDDSIYHVEKKNLASSFEKIESAKTIINSLSNKKNYIIVDKQGFPV